MIHSQTALSLALLGLASSVFVDCIALTLRAAQRPGRPPPLEGVKLGLSRMIGRIMLALCVPGAIVTTMILVMRGWDDNSRISLLPLLFVAGIGLGMFMSANFRRREYAAVAHQ